MSLLTIRAMSAAATITGTPPVTQTLDVSSGPNESPKAAIYELSSGVTLGTQVAPWRIGFGMTDGTLQRVGMCLAEDNVSANTADTGNRSDDATIIDWSATGSEATLDGEASWSSWHSNGSDISWADLMTTAHLIKATYFFGTAVEVAVAQLASSATIDTDASITGLSFEPNFGIAFTNRTTFAADSSAAQAKHGIGFFAKHGDGTIGQAGAYVFARDRNNPTSCACTLYDTRFIKTVVAQTGGGAPPEDTGLELKSFNSDGITVTTRDSGSAVTCTYLLFRIPKHRVWVGVPSIDATTTGNKQITEPGFKPKCYFVVATSQTTKNTMASDAASGRISSGIATGTEEICVAVCAEDGAATSNTTSVTASDILHLPDNVGTTDWSASHVSMDAKGATINVDDASAVDRVAVFAFISEDPVGHGYLMDQPRQRPCTRRKRM